MRPPTFHVIPEPGADRVKVMTEQDLLEILDLELFRLENLVFILIE